MGQIKEYLTWAVDKFQETPAAYDLLFDYVSRNINKLGPEYSIEAYLENEKKYPDQKGNSSNGQ